MKINEYYCNTHGLISLYQDYVRISEQQNPDKFIVLEILYTMRHKINETIKLWEHT
jgi:hypothetical protein